VIPTTDEDRVAPRGVGKYLAQIAMVFAVQFAAGKLGDALATINSGGIGPVWPASGIALAALLLFGYQVWPGVAAGAFLLAFSSPLPHWAAAVYATGTTLAALLAVFLLRSIAGFDHSLSRLRDVLALVVLGGFGSNVVSASIGASTLYAAHIRGWSGLGSAWLIYWLGDSTGVLVVTPLVLTLPALFRIRDRHRLAEFAVLLLLLMATSFAAFGLLPLSPGRVHHLAFAVLPFVMWAAIRLGMGATALSILLLATIATVETALGSGPFTTNIPLMNAVLLDIFFAVVSVTGLTLAAAIAEREQAEREREQLVREQAAMEARLRLATIVESSDDAIIGMDMNGMITDWNKGAERLYGYSAGEVIGQMISLLVPPGRSDDCAEIMSKVKHGDRVSHHEIECQKKDGTCVEVSLTVSPIIDTEGRSTGSSAITRDITELKRQGAVLRESEERFRLVADTAPVLIWMSGTDKLCTYFNKPWLDFTGRSIDEELGNGWASGVHPEDLQRCLDTYTQSFDRREKFRMEYRLRRHDGEYRWILDIGVPRFGQDRSFVGYIGIGVDDTDRKRAEEALRESEDKLRLLLDSTAEAIYGIDLKHRCTFCNPACLRILGYEHTDQVLGKNTHDLLHHHRQDGTLFTLEECRVHRVTRTGEGVHAEDEVFWRANGTSFPVEYWSYPQRRGDEVVGAVVAFLDITERKLAEEALLSSERRYRLLFERNVAGVGIASLDGRLLDCNDGWARILGYLSKDELRGRHASEFYFNPAERQSLVDELFEKQVLFSRELQLKRKDGTSVWVLFNAAVYSDHDRPIVQATMIDISEWKRADEALSGMTRKLIEAQEQERARIGRELHDDINQRLAMLALELEQLQENPSEIQPRVKELRREMAEVSNDVQAMSHDLHSSKLEYLGVVAGIKSWCKEFSERQRVELDFNNDVHSALPFEIGLSLFRVLQEALHNATKHSGVKRIEVQLREESGEIHLIIRDSGKGFDVEAALQGKGLGLTSMRERVRLVNGTISIESKPMGGTTIHVRVPPDSKQDSQRQAV